MANFYRKSEIPAHLQQYFEPAEIGLEATPELYVAELVAVFREVWRVLRDDGTVWLNLGDSYVGSANNGGVETKTMQGTQAATGKGLPTKRGNGLKPKDLIGIPWRVAFALQADGWYLRQDIIWHKPNPMPESVTDRCTKAHEYIFLLSKSARYYYDAEAVAEPITSLGFGGISNKSSSKRNGTGLESDINYEPNGTRNRRSVWTVATKPYAEAHFATYPPELITPCILAGCPVGGTVLDPFGGSGTTAAVAISHGRNAILCELNPDYGELIHERVGEALTSYKNAAGELVTTAKEDAQGKRLLFDWSAD